MKKRLIHLVLGTLVLLAACSKETELKKSVFIPDHDFPDLPACSEWGYNTFGAYYDRELFIYSESEVPAKVINTGGKTSFILKGSKGNPDSDSYSYSYDHTEMSIRFEMHSFHPQAYTDLIALDDTLIDLTNPLNIVLVTIDTVEFAGQILNGSLKINRAQNLIVDKNLVEVILSGEFAFQVLVDEEPVSVTEGRFDVGIGTDNFFLY